MNTRKDIRYGLGAVIIAASMIQGAWAADIMMTGNAAVSGTLSATALTGNGSGLTNIKGSSLAFYDRVAIVALSGGDYPNPADAMTDLPGWCSSPTAASPCLLKIMPGVYNIGTGTVQMHQYVDIEGSGENTTVITGSVNTTTWAPPPPLGVVNGANNAEIRYLKVTNTGAGTGNSAAGMVNINASPKITNVTVTASGAVYSLGIRNNNSAPVMTNVTVSAIGTTYNWAIYNDTSASPTITNAQISATGGAYNYGVFIGGSSAKVKINQSVIKASNATIDTGAGATAFVFTSQLDGGAATTAGTLTCFGVFDENYSFYPDTCP